MEKQEQRAGRSKSQERRKQGELGEQRAGRGQSPGQGEQSAKTQGKEGSMLL